MAIIFFGNVFIIGGGLMVLATNVYADVNLPFWRRLASAFDVMWIDEVLPIFGLG